MKTLRIASMIIMVLVTIFFIVFARIQTSYAEESIKMAELMKVEVEHIRKEMEMMQKEAENQAAMAMRAEAHASKLIAELKNCQSK